MRRARESKEHLSIKSRVEELLRKPRYLVTFEECYCDIIAYEISTSTIFGIEIERSTRNSFRNVTRNLRSGCHYVISITPDSKVADALKSSMAKLSPSMRQKHRIFTYAEFEALISKETTLSNLFKSQEGP